jgi:hypothetical protein
MVVLQQGYARGRLSTVYATARGTGPALSAGLAVLLLGERISPVVDRADELVHDALPSARQAGMLGQPSIADAYWLPCSPRPDGSTCHRHPPPLTVNPVREHPRPHSATRLLQT